MTQSENAPLKEGTPSDWDNPIWDNDNRVHNWHNYISEDLRELWPTFNPAQKQAIALSAEEAAGGEHWD